MKLMPKIVFVIGLLLIAFSFAITGDYRGCHSDFIIAGYNDSASCFPDIVYQFKEVSIYVGVGCLFAAAIIKESLLVKEKSPTSILKIK